MVALLVIVAFELSFLVRYITRFTEECFACLVMVIIMYEGCRKVADIMNEQPVHTGVVREDEPLLCHCVPQPPANSTSSFGMTMTGEAIFQIA